MLFSDISGMKVLMNEPLALHTSFHVGGRARYFIQVNSLRALKQAFMIINNRKMQYIVLGAGTNVLFGDDGFPGVIIVLDGLFKKIGNKQHEFSCGAGALIEKVLQYAASAGYGGAEFLTGIPGTIGGAIHGNAGAFGKAIANITKGISVLTSDGKKKNLIKSQIGFTYRKSKIPDDFVILNAILTLKEKAKALIYKKMARIKELRDAHQPSGYSAGSFFKNPRNRSAGRIIEECGLKGMRIGHAEVSRQHANWIINRGSATASDIIALAQQVKEIVRKQKGISLTEEVKILD